MKKISGLFLIFCLLAVGYQNCGEGMVGANVKSFSSTDPNLIEGLAFSIGDKNEIGTLFGEEWTIFAILPRVTESGIILNINNGLNLSEGILVSVENFQLKIEIAVDPGRSVTITSPVTWNDKNLLVLTVPRDVGKTGVVFNGRVLSFENGNEDRGSFVERKVYRNAADSLRATEMFGYNRLISRIDLSAVHGYFQSIHFGQVTLQGWERLHLNSGGSSQFLSFQRDIQPIFQANHCYECHGSDRPALSTYTPSEIETSIMRSVAWMPETYPPLTNEEKRKVQDWVDQGARP